MRQSEFKKRYDVKTGRCVKTMKEAAKTATKKAVQKAATKTGEYDGEKAGDKIIQLLSKKNKKTPGSSITSSSIANRKSTKGTNRLRD